MAIVWTDEMNVGIKSIDGQHVHLVDLINDFSRAVNEACGTDVYHDLADDLANYAKVHFEDEERLMRSYHYPGYLEQESEHAQFILLVVMMNSRPGRKENCPEAIAEFLNKWIAEHVMVCDKKLGEYLREKGVS